MEFTTEFSGSLQSQPCGGDCPPTVGVTDVTLNVSTHQSDHLPSKTISRKCVLEKGKAILLIGEAEDSHKRMSYTSAVDTFLEVGGDENSVSKIWETWSGDKQDFFFFFNLHNFWTWIC